MAIFLVLLGIVLIVLIPITVEILIPSLILRLSRWDSRFSPFILKPPSGEMYILVKGSPDGPYEEIVESVVDYDYEEYGGPLGPHTFIKKDDKKKDDKKKDDKEIKAEKEEPKGYLENLGVKRKSLWTYRLYRKVQYDKWEKLPNSDEYGLVPKVRGIRPENLTADQSVGSEGNPSIFFRYQMGTKIHQAEIKGNIRVDAIMVFTVQLTNPVQAYFFAGGWESQVTAAIQTRFREFVQDKDFDTIRKDQAIEGGDELVKQIKNLGGVIWKEGAPKPEVDLNGLFARFGIEIVDVRFVSFDAVHDEDVLEALQAKEKALHHARAKIVTAKGNKKAAEIEADGIVADRKARSSVEGWQTIEIADALRKTQLTALGGDIFTAINPPSKEAKRKE
jgi:hypothetical protein